MREVRPSATVRVGGVPHGIGASPTIYKWLINGQRPEGVDVDNPIGQKLTGYMGGYFGRDSYGDREIVAFGEDWTVARDLDSGKIEFAPVNFTVLIEASQDL